eukprot:3296055-Rhodomonas_salina.3
MTAGSLTNQCPTTAAMVETMRASESPGSARRIVANSNSTAYSIASTAASSSAADAVVLPG